MIDLDNRSNIEILDRDVEKLKLSIMKSLETLNVDQIYKTGLFGWYIKQLEAEYSRRELAYLGEYQSDEVNIEDYIPGLKKIGEEVRRLGYIVDYSPFKGCWIFTPK